MVQSQDFRRALEEVSRQNAEYSQMPLEARIEVLKRLKQLKRGLEEGMSDVETRIMFLEHMPEVAGYRAEHDKIAMALLEELKGKKGILYIELTKHYDSSMKFAFFRYLTLLKTAEFLDFKENPVNSIDAVISLTEKGRNAQYKEQTK